MRIPYLSSMQVVLRRTLILVFLAALGLLFFTTPAPFQSQAKPPVLQAPRVPPAPRTPASVFPPSI